MPCDSSHMAANRLEIEMSKVACLLDELNGHAIKEGHWGGYHPRVYCKNIDRKMADDLISELCSKLQAEDVTKCSLEMQLWWRDHQEDDRRRVQKEVAATKERKERDAAIAKLTPRERTLLGVK